MPYIPFQDLYPRISKDETRTLYLMDPKTGIPEDGYVFFEMFCDEPGCDCRRVFFLVCSEKRKKPLAVIAWGWESLKFYREWASFDPDPAMVRDLKGPVLNVGSPQSPLAPSILELCKDVLLQDPAYIERIKRHYAMFREKIDRPNRIAQVSVDEGLASLQEQTFAKSDNRAVMTKNEAAMLKRKMAVLEKKEALLKKMKSAMRKKKKTRLATVVSHAADRTPCRMATESVA